MSMCYRIIVSLLLLTMSMTFICGCGPSGPKRVVVSGTVTYLGKPIERGTIRFVPTGETRGPATAATISQGKYEVSAKGGVLVGTHKVEITAIATDNAPRGQDPDSMEVSGMQYLPQKYNRQSTLTVTVEPGGSGKHNFDLK